MSYVSLRAMVVCEDTNGGNNGNDINDSNNGHNSNDSEQQ